MQREKLIAELEEAIRTEETATTVFLTHIDAFSERLPLKDPFLKKIKKVLRYLITQNKRHKEICLGLLKQVKKEKRHVY